ncbi:nitronate monooxygenase family protein [Reyranella sp. CPCC 100927]|uniref:NAD(P)H-dependent flavin oxidoreductase n=1 Tax=Reyranella sp. CPCC 100927 TaxID=2599616 RepID=UPI001C49896D|nr:nitronate monooxygenase [Reyranella sp. CPCC 100927]
MRFEDAIGRLRLPVIAAPMFLVSGPDLVIAAAQTGIIGSFPAPNARTIETLDRWLADIHAALEGTDHLWALNFVTHRSYDRLGPELDLVSRHRPPIVITALGSPAPAVRVARPYGGLVFADVSTPVQGRKAIDAGADGLVLVCAGAGGHTGGISPFAFVAEVRRFWSGPLVLAGAVGEARAILAAQTLGADLVYMGTRFIAAAESMASETYRAMLVRANAADIVQTRAVTGVPGNFLRESLSAAGLDAASAAPGIDFAGLITDGTKAWKHVWSAGQGVGSVTGAAPIATIVSDIEAEYTRLRRPNDARNVP